MVAYGKCKCGLTPVVLFQPVEPAVPGVAGEPAQVPPLLPLLPRQTTDTRPRL